MAMATEIHISYSIYINYFNIPWLIFNKSDITIKFYALLHHIFYVKIFLLSVRVYSYSTHIDTYLKVFQFLKQLKILEFM